MANTFKNAALADVNSAGYDVLYTAPGSITTIILAVALANKTGNAINATVRFTDSSAVTDYQLLDQILIPGNTTLEVLSGQKYILETGDSLSVQSDTASALDVVAGVMEVS
jgi:hypothetical protein